MATLDVTEKVNVLVDAIGWEGFCEELMARMDEDALDAVCDRIAPRYGVELAGSRYAAYRHGGAPQGNRPSEPGICR